VKKASAFLLLILLSLNLFAQESQTIMSKSGRLADRQNASKYILSAGSDALLMTVKIWGEVTKPGLYDVPIGTDLIELISAAGGPTTRANLSKVRVIHNSPESGEDYVTMVNIKQFLNTGNSADIPEIKPSDTIIMPVKPLNSILTSLSWTQQLLNLLSVMTMIYYYREIARNQ
jgi:hypothetical protein